MAAFNERLDRFAELLSLDLPMPVIRQRMGLTNSAAQGLMHRLRQKLGWQAQ
jgi:hypothetical protein